MMKNRITHFLADWPDGSSKPSLSDAFAQRWAERMADIILNPKDGGPKPEAIMDKLGHIAHLANLGKLVDPASSVPCVVSVRTEGMVNHESVSLELEVVLGIGEARLFITGMPSGDSQNTYMVSLDSLRAFYNAIGDLLNDPTATYLLTSAIETPTVPPTPTLPPSPESSKDRKDAPDDDKDDEGEGWKHA